MSFLHVFSIALLASHVFLIALLASSNILFLSLTHTHNAKKCKFDCSKCKNWDCMYHYFSKKRLECSSERSDKNV